MSDIPTPPSSQPEASGEPAPDATVRLTAPLAEADRTLRLEPPPVLVPPPSFSPVPDPPAPGVRRSRKGWILGGLLLAVVAGGTAWFLRPRAEVPPPAAQAPVPPGVQVYLDKARTGDHQAMYMLGTMYYYGLYVPRDQEQGIRWYREAAAHGSQAARDDLAKLQPKAGAGTS